MAQATYLIAWDISDPSRLQRVSRTVKGWKASGQKSLAECWLTQDQRLVLMRRLEDLVDPASDRLCAIRLDPRCEVILFGLASRPDRERFIVV